MLGADAAPGGRGRFSWTWTSHSDESVTRRRILRRRRRHRGQRPAVVQRVDRRAIASMSWLTTRSVPPEQPLQDVVDTAVVGSARDRRVLGRTRSNAPASKASSASASARSHSRGNPRRLASARPVHALVEMSLAVILQPCSASRPRRRLHRRRLEGSAGRFVRPRGRACRWGCRSTSGRRCSGDPSRLRWPTVGCGPMSSCARLKLMMAPTRLPFAAAGIPAGSGRPYCRRHRGRVPGFPVESVSTRSPSPLGCAAGWRPTTRTARPAPRIGGRPRPRRRRCARRRHSTAATLPPAAVISADLPVDAFTPQTLSP